MKKFLAFLTSIGGWIFTLICSAVIIGCIAVFMVFQHYTKDLPDYSQLSHYEPPTVTRLYAADGRLIEEYAVQKRVYVPLVGMPKRVINAFLSAEDKHFYTHTGIDYQGIARAVFVNILNYGQNKSLVGGSTITQQVVKNFLLTNEKSIARKVREAVLAIRITNAYSKDRILELYLNEIFLGNRSYGVAAAALNYFNHSLDELSIEEAALLAALPKAPAFYDPRKNYEKAKGRRDWVLSRMHEDGHITESEMLEAQKSPIVLRKRTADEKVDAPYFAEEVRRWLAEKMGNDVVTQGGLAVQTTLNPQLQKFADAALRHTLMEYDRKRGYRGAVGHIEDVASFVPQLAALTELPQKLIDGQELAAVLAVEPNRAVIGLKSGDRGVIPQALLGWTRRVMSDGSLGAVTKKPADILKVGDVVIVGAPSAEQKASLKGEDAKNAWDLQQVPLVNGALVAMEPHSGKILAMSGGYLASLSDFNRATQALRQPGSAFKPFVYLSAFESGMTPATRVLDAPIELNQGANQQAWRPENYGNDYLGPTTLRKGLEKSRNTMTVRIGQTLGMDRILEVSKRFGIYDNPPRNLSIVLGASETTVARLSAAYASIANGGLKVTPSLVERVDNRHGKAIYKRDERNCAACVVSDAQLEAGNVSAPVFLDGRERIVDARIAYQISNVLQGVVQRGTAARARNLPWSIGGKTGTTNESRDVWFMGITPELVVGVFIGYDTPQSLGPRETGSSLALPAFMEFAEHALKDTPNVPFVAPSGLELLKVDSATGFPIQPWEDDGRATMWEVFLREDVPLFKPESLLALGELSDERRAYLGTQEHLSDMDHFLSPDILPWLQHTPYAPPEQGEQGWNQPAAAPRQYREPYPNVTGGGQGAIIEAPAAPAPAVEAATVRVHQVPAPTAKKAAPVARKRYVPPASPPPETPDTRKTFGSSPNMPLLY